MQAWIDFGNSYDIFTRRTEKMTSTVVFVYKSEARLKKIPSIGRDFLGIIKTVKDGLFFVTLLLFYSVQNIESSFFTHSSTSTMLKVSSPVRMITRSIPAFVTCRRHIEQFVAFVGSSCVCASRPTRVQRCAEHIAP